MEKENMIKIFNINKKSTQSGRKERPECSADTKLFFDDVYKSGTRGKKQQVETIQSERSILSKCAGYTQYFLSDVYTNSTRTKKAQVETVQCGRSMIEMLGVLAIVGVLSVGGIAGYSKAMEKFKINKTIDEISQVISNTRTLYAQQENYYGLRPDIAINTKIIPDSMSITTTNNNYEILHPFGGEFNVYSPYGHSDRFVIHLDNIPKNVCIELATKDWGSLYTSGLIAIAVSTGPLSSVEFVNSYVTQGCNYDNTVACPGDTQNPAPMPVSRAASLCNCPNNDCKAAMSFK